MRKPAAHKLRERVYFERRGANTRGVPAGFARLYPETGSISAEIMPVRGNEEVLSHRLTGVTVFEIVVRGNAGTAALRTDDRCINARSGDVYNIRAIVNPDQRGQWYHLTCESGVAT
jgi:head-tail adaptor